jgi:hypothetical protein
MADESLIPSERIEKAILVAPPPEQEKKRRIGFARH